MTIVVGIGFFCSSETLICWLAAVPLDSKSADQIALRLVNGMTWCADGKTLVSQSRGGDDAQASLAIHDLKNSTWQIRPWGDEFSDLTNDATPSPDCRWILLGTLQAKLWWIDVETREVIEVATTSAPSFAETAVSHDGCTLAGATDRGHIYLCHPTRGTSNMLATQRSSTVSELRFSRNDRRLLAARLDGSVEVWDVETGVLLGERIESQFRAVAAFLPEGDRVISSAGDDYVQIWDVATSEVLWREPERMQGEYGRYNHLDITSDGSIAAWGGFSHKVVVWDFEHSRKRFEIDNPAMVLQIRFSPDGKLLAVAGQERLIRIYDTTTGIQTAQIDTDPRSGS
jgi:WD40 repeat protein